MPRAAEVLVRVGAWGSLGLTVGTSRQSRELCSEEKESGIRHSVCGSSHFHIIPCCASPRWGDRDRGVRIGPGPGLLHPPSLNRPSEAALEVKQSTARAWGFDFSASR